MNSSRDMRASIACAAIGAMSLFLGVGILLVFVACVNYDNWWPMLTVVMHAFALLWPMLCDGYTGMGSSDGADAWLYSDPEDKVLEDCASLGWFMLAVFFVSGYALPVIMFHAGLVPQPVVLLTIIGGTLVWASIIIFMQLFCCAKLRQGSF